VHSNSSTPTPSAASSNSDWPSSKSDARGDDLAEGLVDGAFAALAHPTRRAVLERLRAGSATIGELAEPFGMTLTGMTKHIRMLEEAHLVTTEKVGRVRTCALAPPGSRTSTNGSSDSRPKAALTAPSQA
jgi:DNA-binding transcriptional ArsR family regulator